jgi:putrescine importer
VITATAQELKRVLGTGALLAVGLAYLVPLTVFTTFGSVTRMTAGHLPLAYLITTVAMVFTATSYAQLVRAFPSAGSAYAYARGTFGERIGFIVGWVLLLDYLLLPAINYLVIALYLHAQFPQISSTALIFSALTLVTVLNIIGIGSVRNVSLLLVVAQLIFAVVFTIAAVSHVDGRLTVQAFYSSGIVWPSIFAGSAVLCLSFLGFDAVSTLTEEARAPERTVPRAILLTTLCGGFIFTVLSYCATLVIPDWRTLRVSDSAGLEVMGPLGGHWMIAFFLSTYIAGSFASAVAAQASVSRILFAMGRDGVLPARYFGVLNARFRTPVRAILIVAALSTVVLLTTLDTLAAIISFGALSAFLSVNLAVLKRFLIDEHCRGARNVLRYGLLPALGVAATSWLWLSLSLTALIIGLSWLSIGALYLLIRIVRMGGNAPAIEEQQ